MAVVAVPVALVCVCIVIYVLYIYIHNTTILFVTTSFYNLYNLGKIKLYLQYMMFVCIYVHCITSIYTNIMKLMCLISSCIAWSNLMSNYVSYIHGDVYIKGCSLPNWKSSMLQQRNLQNFPFKSFFACHLQARKATTAMATPNTHETTHSPKPEDSSNNVWLFSGSK